MKRILALIILVFTAVNLTAGHRILLIGDSITLGVGSTLNDGFRHMLADSLTALDFPHTFVGSYGWEIRYRNGYNLPPGNGYGGGYNHLDYSWSWNYEVGDQKVYSDWSMAADCLDEKPGHYGGHAGMQYANWAIKNKYPDLWQRIKGLSDAGRYDASELSWSEGYTSFGGDEYNVRNFFISYRFCKDNFGYAPLINASDCIETTVVLYEIPPSE